MYNKELNKDPNKGKYKVNEFSSEYTLVDTYYSDKPVSDILPHIWARKNNYEIWEDQTLIAASAWD